MSPKTRLILKVCWWPGLLIGVAISGLALGGHRLELSASVGAGALGLAAGLIFRHLLAALGAVVLGTIPFALAHAIAIGEAYGGDDWTDYDTGILASITLVIAFVAMLIGAVVGWAVRQARVR